ncbi:unnamed protein product [Parajaminaea phylloscopi]
MASLRATSGADGDDAKSTASSSGSTSASRLERLQSHMLTSLLSLQSIPPPSRMPVTKSKEPLSLPTTTRNFRGFVQKSGPVFLIQDTVHETLMWDYPARTLCVMGCWAVIAIHPYLLVPLPAFLLTLLLLQTYQARFPVAADTDEAAAVKPADVLKHALEHPTSTGHGKVQPPMVPEPPNEGSIKYYENLRDIQNMMKMITDAYDLLAPLSIHLNWSSPQHTLLIFQVLVVATLALCFIAPYLPYRLILLVAGEGAFLLNHPWADPVLKKLVAKVGEGREGRKMKEAQRRAVARMNEWIKMDQLPDEVWTRGWREVEVFENERFSDDASTARAALRNGLGVAGKWSGHNLRYGERRPWTKGADGYADEALQVEGYSLDVSRQVAMSLEDGWEWIEGDEWRIDFLGRWSPHGVDESGWVYTDSDWHKPSPYSFGHAGHPALPKADKSSALDSGDEDDGDDNGSTGATGTARGAHDGDDDETLPDDVTFAASKSGKAETRRRRWLRRAARTEGSSSLSASQRM